MTTVLIVDDVPAMREQYAYDLRRLGGYQTLTAGDGAAALEMLRSEPVDCVILDLEMPGVDGFEVLKTLRERGSQIPVIVYTGTGNYDRCVRAVKLGAYNFIDKSEPAERVAREVENGLEKLRLTRQVADLKRRAEVDTPLIGESPAMVELRAEIEKLAPIPSPVLILGESGSGKELVARELHNRGPRRSGPFVGLIIAALPETLVESEIFGHERGAFTGATRTRPGAFETAHGGTLFLDEIGDLALTVQVKLLRVLENEVVTHLGGSKPIQLDTRVVAATHRDLEAAVAAGSFRQDLLYRINAHVLRVPPLRQHLSDIPDLVEHLAARACERFGIRPKAFSAGAVAQLGRYDWARNNVRELRNVVERMIMNAGDGEVEEEHVPPEIQEPAGPGKSAAAGGPLLPESAPGGSAPSGTGTIGLPRPGSAAGGPRRPHPAGDGPSRPERVPGAGSSRLLRDRKAEAEKRILLEALERNGWHITRTAEELGLADHSSLLKIMKRHGLRR
jgi:DNA-binding NtrC family response regulator